MPHLPPEIIGKECRAPAATHDRIPSFRPQAETPTWPACHQETGNADSRYLVRALFTVLLLKIPVRIVDLPLTPPFQGGGNSGPGFPLLTKEGPGEVTFIVFERAQLMNTRW